MQIWSVFSEDSTLWNEEDALCSVPCVHAVLSVLHSVCSVCCVKHAVCVVCCIACEIKMNVCKSLVLMPTSVNFVFSSPTLRWFFVMVGYQVTGAIMTEFLGKSELNQQDTGSSENTTAKSTKAEESKRANVQKTS